MAKKQAKKTPTRPTTEERAAQIEALKKIKPTVLRTSAFGDNHHDAIDAQLDVLEKLLTEREIYGNQESEEGADDGWSLSVTDAAINARNWLDGQYEDYPDLVASWKELVR